MKERIIKKICDEHNKEYPKNGILEADKNYLTNLYNVRLGCRKILDGLNEREAFKVVAAIRLYAMAQAEK